MLVLVKRVRMLVVGRRRAVVLAVRRKSVRGTVGEEEDYGAGSGEKEEKGWGPGGEEC